MGFLNNPNMGSGGSATVTINGKTGTTINLDKSDLSLDNVTNDAQVKRSELAIANGVATLNSSSKLVQMPTKTDIGLSNVDNLQQIPLSQKGAVSGVASLDASGKVPITQLNITGASISVQANQTARLAMSTSTNMQIAVQADTQRVWALNPNLNPATASNWVDMGSSASTVVSVNGATGAVTINCAGIGAVPTNTTVNGKALSGSITLSISDLITLTNTGIKFLADDGTFKTITTMTGATSSADGISGLVTKPTAGQQGKFYRGDGTWSNVMNNVAITSNANVGAITNTLYDVTISTFTSTIALPSTASTGDCIKIITSINGFTSANYFTVTGNINGSASNSIIVDHSFGLIEFIYSATNNTWITAGHSIAS